MKNALEIWSKEVDFPVTICDRDGIIIALNDESIEYFKGDGGTELLGKQILDCHPEPSRTKLMHMLENQQTNTYIVTENGQKKLVHETPWYEKSEYRGFVEILINLPE